MPGGGSPSRSDALLAKTCPSPPLELLPGRGWPLPCYPPGRPGCLDRIASLEVLGVERICGVIGKGHTGVILSGIALGRVTAVKVRRLDSRRATLEYEARRLYEAARHGASPRPLAWNRDAIVMELVEGPVFAEALKDNRVKAITEAIKAARALDSAGILHYEIHRPWRNVVFTSYNLSTALIVDLDSAGEGCGNAARLIGGLLPRFPELHRSDIHGLLRDYKKECSIRAYQALVKAVEEALLDA